MLHKPEGVAGGNQADADRGLTCPHCEKTIAEALIGAGAQKVEASWRKGRAILETVGASDEQLKAAVEEAGYKVTSIEAAQAEKHGFEAMVGHKSHHYDPVVLGSGSAAFAAAIKATESGARVALMESNVVGSTCVNIGCVRSKAMLAPADAYFRAGHHPFAAIQTSANGFDLGAMADAKAELVDQLRTEKYLDLAREYGFTVCHGRAEFVDAETIECDGERIQICDPLEGNARA